MLRRTPLLDRFERDQIASEPPDYFRSLAIFEALWAEAVALGVLPFKDPLEGIEGTIELARALHVRTTPGTDR